MSAKRWHYFVAYTGAAKSGATYTANTEVISPVPADSYEVIQGWTEEIKRDNDRVASVVILNFQLLRTT